MKIKPKEVFLNLPAAHLFDNQQDISDCAQATNRFIHGKVKVKFEILGELGGKLVGLFYLQRNDESQEIHDEFVRLIEEEETAGKLLQPDADDEDLNDEEISFIEQQHLLCNDCQGFRMLHVKELEHCVCGGDWDGNGCEYQ
jgi:hypothetical protein